ncbi:MAG: acyl-CoA dehydrogenase family protein [Chloroflexota bacterium]
MDFTFTPEEEAFREEIRAFLRQNPPQNFPVDGVDAGFGFGNWSSKFARAVADKGLISKFWPKENGGEGASFMELLIRMEEFAYAEAPLYSIMTGESVARLLIKHGNDFLKREFLPKIAKAEIFLWLAFSEPNAGSDLLAVETKAEKDGDYYVINGQKTWSANAHLADFGYLLVRTDSNVPRHKGLSMFILDKNAPGVTVRPLLNLEGYRYHNEVFMDNVRIHKDYLVGGENQGFYQMLGGLDHDRFWARFVKAPFCKKILEQIVDYVKETKDGGKPLGLNPHFRRRLAEMATETESCRLLFYRTAWMLQKGQSPTYEGVLAKAFADEMGQRFFGLGVQVLGLYPRPGEDPKWEALRKKLIHLYQFSLGVNLAGGTPEIMRNTAAIRGLRMPVD